MLFQVNWRIIYKQYKIILLLCIDDKKQRNHIDGVMFSGGSSTSLVELRTMKLVFGIAHGI
jgi:glutamine amidotransferase PdxT